MNTLTRREVAHRITSLGLSAVLTLSILASINLLAVEPAPDSLLEDPDRIGPRHGARVGRRTGIAANRLRRDRPGPRESGEARLDAPARVTDHRLAEVS